ncbi:hypothetical protein MUK42_13484 [Musa troglodytarum]|uniref:Uncharacterized protein n=1 Tax=Musa troglodytarum TaxID=320322 RepID=A0A9E7KZD5_9LILI|nr:hypothetical protein MUK42_13484 [Musa troglodytarum]
MNEVEEKGMIASRDSRLVALRPSFAFSFLPLLPHCGPPHAPRHVISSSAAPGKKKPPNLD